MTIGAKIALVTRACVIAVWIWGIMRYMYPDNHLFAGTLIVWIILVGFIDLIHTFMQENN